MAKDFLSEVEKKALKAGMFGEGVYGIDKKDIAYAFKGCNSVKMLMLDINDISEKLTIPEKIKGAFIHIGYEKGVEARCCHKIVETIGERLNPDTRIVWSATLQKTPNVRILVGR